MRTGPSQLVILDRDGVINQDSAQFIKSPDEFIPLPGSIEAIGDLSSAGFRVFVATNQSGIGRGLFDEHTLDLIHAKLHEAVASVGGTVSGIFYCPHKPGDGCECRKPKPGLLQQIADACDGNLQGVPVIGDSQRDLDAAIAVGAQPVLVRSGNGRRTESELRDGNAIPVFDDLAAVAAAIITSNIGPVE